jgi:membrane peptidoglycan carboxypeptidase
LLGILAVVGVFVWAYATTQLPVPAGDAFAQTTKVYYADGTTLMGEFSAQNRTIVPLSELPPHVGEAVVAAEDRSFWNNAGVDPVGLARAFYNNLRGGRRQGGSTITQQYIERYFVGKTTTDLMGKFREAILAVKVTREKDKSEILADYLNTIYFGRGAYGIETAAVAYFGVHASELDVSQAALLAGMVPAPSAFDPAVDLGTAIIRWNYVLDGMVETGALTPTERAELTFPDTIEHEVPNLYGGTRGYLLQMVREEMTSRGGLTETELDEGGLVIVTTVNQAWQRAAVQAVRNLPDDRPKNLHVAAVSIDPTNGGITALYGGPNYIKRQQNAATQDIAQAGSTFKPIALAAALASGEHSLSDWYSGRSPIEIGDWKVENIGGRSYGSMSLLQATENSVNTVYAQLNEEVGGVVTRKMAIDLGLPEATAGLDTDITNVLGTASPHPLDLANVYATLAADGVRHEPHIVAAAKNPGDVTVYAGPTTGKRVLDADIAAEVTYALTQVVEVGTGTAAKELGRPAAAKTGTSEEHRSAWFVGYTPQAASAVAFYQEGENGKVVELTPFAGLSEINGGALPAKVWVEMMAAEHEELDVVEFPERPGGASSPPRQPQTDPTASATPTVPSTEKGDDDGPSEPPTPSPDPKTEQPEPPPVPPTAAEPVETFAPPPAETTAAPPPPPPQPTEEQPSTQAPPPPTPTPSEPGTPPPVLPSDSATPG